MPTFSQLRVCCNIRGFCAPHCTNKDVIRFGLNKGEWTRFLRRSLRGFATLQITSFQIGLKRTFARALMTSGTPKLSTRLQHNILRREYNGHTTPPFEEVTNLHVSARQTLKLISHSTFWWIQLLCLSHISKHDVEALMGEKTTLTFDSGARINTSLAIVWYMYVLQLWKYNNYKSDAGWQE